MVVIAERRGLREQEKRDQCLVSSCTAEPDPFSRDTIHLHAGLVEPQIVVGGENPKLIATIALKLRFVSKHQGAHDRMQLIGTHQQVEPAGAATLKDHVNSSLVLLELLDGVSKAIFHLVRRSIVECPGEIAPHDLHPETMQVEGLAQGVHVDTANALIALIDKRDLPEGRLLLLQTRPDPYELGNLHGLRANVNRVPAFSQLWRALDYSRVETIALKPIRQGRPSNTGP